MDPFKSFIWDSGRDKIHFTMTKEQHAAQERAWRKANPEESRARSRRAGAKRRADQPEVIRAYQRKWRAEHPEYKTYMKNYQLQRRVKDLEGERKRRREYMRAWIAKNPGRWKVIYTRTAQKRRAARTETINKMKVELGCALCGYRENPNALAFDHLDQARKSFNVGTGKSLSWPRVLAEIAKCRVLCFNCHQIETTRLRHTAFRRAANRLSTASS
jgi:hypothetical protein